MSSYDVPMESPPPLLAMHIAEYEASQMPLWTKEEIADHFNITVEQIDHYYTLPSFRADVRANLETLKDSHAHIKHKAQAQLEFYIDKVIPGIMLDAETPPGEKTKILQFLAKTARVNDDPLEKAKAEVEANSKVPSQNAPTLNLYLTTTPGKEPIPIDVTPEKVVVDEQ